MCVYELDIGIGLRVGITSQCSESCRYTFQVQIDVIVNKKQYFCDMKNKIIITCRKMHSVIECCVFSNRSSMRKKGLNICPYFEPGRVLYRPLMVCNAC